MDHPSHESYRELNERTERSRYIDFRKVATYLSDMKIRLLAYRDAPATIFESGFEQLVTIIDRKLITLVQEDADVLFFLTGGSERPAVESIVPGKFVCLIGSRKNNAYASASEVMAFIRGRGSQALLLDQDDPQTPVLLRDLHPVLDGIQRLRGKKLGLIGQVSEWLVASSISAQTLETKLGIVLEQLRWNELPSYAPQIPDPTLLSSFSASSTFDLTDTARVATLLRTLAHERSYDAITVECFSLVKSQSITACLPLAQFNAEGFPAACEGDIASAVGMMLGKEIAGAVPWLANLNKVDDESCMFSHCTIAPTLVSQHEIRTHFETGKGTAINGYFAGNFVTVFRLNDTLTRAFIASGPVTGRPHSDSACRTQIEVKLPKSGVTSLREHPLGNHHLIFSGDAVQRLSLACTILGVKADKHQS